ncbi:MAG: hypothetical protein U0572_00385 [Phycisphaerales bacterium]
MSQVDPYEELASLFLTGGPNATNVLDAGDPPVEVAIATSVEIALVGHLPVMGGLWLTQYADQLGRQHGPTALVRLERGQATIELLRAPGARGTLDTIETFDEALHLVAGVARHWIVCPPGEAAIDGPFIADALTLLTGSDDAATVAAYRIVKNFAERWHGAGWSVPPIGLVVLGAPSERVAQVAEKLDRTTKAFLDVDMDVTGHYQRMDAIESAGRRTFPGVDLSVVDVCRRINAAANRPRRTEPVQPQRSAPVAKLGPKGIVRDHPHLRTTERSPVDAPPATANQPYASSIPGLEPLGVRCPMHPLVELAVDAGGSLHLVAPLDALGLLRPVEAWAIVHAELLRMACPRLAVVDRVTTHVVTTDAPSIIPLHGSGMKLHLLVATSTGWVHAALS